MNRNAKRIRGLSMRVAPSLVLTIFATAALISMSCSAEDPTSTPLPPTATSVPPTATPIPPTEAPEPQSTESDTTLKIGTVLPQTGDLGFLGKERQLAISFAFDLVNEAGGVNGRMIEVLHRDSGTDPEVGKAAASALIDEHGVPAIIGAASSGVTMAIAQEVTIPNGVLQISPASSSSLITTLDDNDFVFRTTMSDVVTGKVAAELGTRNRLAERGDHARQQRLRHEHDHQLFRAFRIARRQRDDSGQPR